MQPTKIGSYRIELRVRERFRQEARLLWRLDHERLVSVHAVGELDDGRPYAVLAWADGGSLRDRLAAGPLPAEPGVRLLREVAAGVAVLHDSDIVHGTSPRAMCCSGPAPPARNRCSSRISAWPRRWRPRPV
ncbi:protein kinase [Micromonospora sp. NPDC047134]|uniref:protein kinase n=1 Tax=Micromonospora sp. NPDC047134 TaxID=3154340 RepID=UPI0033E85A83